MSRALTGEHLMAAVTHARAATRALDGIMTDARLDTLKHTLDAAIAELVKARHYALGVETQPEPVPGNIAAHENRQRIAREFREIG